MLKYVRALKFEETPKYEQMLNILKEIGKKQNFTFDNIFDWEGIKPGLKIKKTKHDALEVKNAEEEKKAHKNADFNDSHIANASDSASPIRHDAKKEYFQK